MLKIKLESISDPGFELSTFLTPAPVSLPGDTVQKWKRCMIKMKPQLLLPLT